MWAMLLVGALFLAGAAWNVFGPEPDTVEAIGGTCFAAALVGLFLVARHHQQRAEAFEHWLAANAEAIRFGGARHGDTLVKPETVLARYQFAVSFLIVTFRVDTRYYVVGHDATRTVAAVCSAISLLLGWWGIPWGPIHTPQVVARNLRGGSRQTVRELLARPPVVDGAGPAAPDRAA